VTNVGDSQLPIAAATDRENCSRISRETVSQLVSWTVGLTSWIESFVYIILLQTNAAVIIHVVVDRSLAMALSFQLLLSSHASWPAA